MLIPAQLSHVVPQEEVYFAVEKIAVVLQHFVTQIGSPMAMSFELRLFEGDPAVEHELVRSV